MPQRDDYRLESERCGLLKRLFYGSYDARAADYVVSGLRKAAQARSNCIVKYVN